jgi:GABA(A) receptor-associated protein
MSKAAVIPGSFKDKKTFEERCEEVRKINIKHPKTIPVIVERSPDASSDLPHIDKSKFLVPMDLTFGQFIWVIRKRINLKPEKALFVSINGKNPNTQTLMSQVYQEHI